MDQLDRNIINRLQEGFPVCDQPYAGIARELAIEEDMLIERLSKLLACGQLSRFGPMFNVEKMGGAYSLVAMKVPDSRFDEITAIVNRFPEVAHNYKRNHVFNLWFVLATDSPGQLDSVLEKIRNETGLAVYDMPKVKEYRLGTRFQA